MLQKHETCEINPRKRNLVLPNLTVIQTIFMALFLWGMSLTSPILAAGNNPNHFARSECPVAETNLIGPKSQVHLLTFQLKKAVDPGGQLNFVEISTRLQQSNYDFNAQLGADGVTVTVSIQGTVALPNDSWALVQVLDPTGNVVEKYLVATLGGLTGVSDLEH